MSQLLPRKPVPALTVETLDQGRWSLAEQNPENFSLLVFYRGLHCPICKPYLRGLDRQVDAFAAQGVGVIAISTDTQERAREAQKEWGVKNLSIGYGLPVDEGRAWGLYVSTGRGKTSIGIEEPALFCEPGLFLVRPDQTLYAASVQTMPFARPHTEELCKSLEFIIAKDYPARGEA